MNKLHTSFDSHLIHTFNDLITFKVLSLIQFRWTLASHFITVKSLLNDNNLFFLYFFCVNKMWKVWNSTKTATHANAAIFLKNFFDVIVQYNWSMAKKNYFTYISIEFQIYCNSYEFQIMKRSVKQDFKWPRNLVRMFINAEKQHFEWYENFLSISMWPNVHTHIISICLNLYYNNVLGINTD